MPWWQPALAGTITWETGTRLPGEKRVLILIGFMTGGIAMSGTSTPEWIYPALGGGGAVPFT
jgi:hypothetical protein